MMPLVPHSQLTSFCSTWVLLGLKTSVVAQSLLPLLLMANYFPFKSSLVGRLMHPFLRLLCAMKQRKRATTSRYPSHIGARIKLSSAGSETFCILLTSSAVRSWVSSQESRLVCFNLTCTGYLILELCIFVHILMNF